MTGLGERSAGEGRPADGDRPGRAGRSAEAAWLRLLAQLEDDAQAASEGSASAEGAPGSGGDRPATPWRAPEAMPPLPAGLRGRAAAVLQAQSRAAARLAERLAATRAELSAARGVPGALTTGPSAPPVYLDTVG